MKNVLLYSAIIMSQLASKEMFGFIINKYINNTQGSGYFRRRHFRLRNIGRMEHWLNGTLVEWNIGRMEHWFN